MGRSSKKGFQVLKVATFRPIIESFFEELTEENWNLIIAGCINEKTRILLVEFLLDIISSTTTTLYEEVKSNPKCEASIISTLDEEFPRIFSKALYIPDQVEDETFRCLTGMIQAEVKNNLEAVLSENKERVTPYFGLDTMINYASALMERFSKKMKKSFAPKKWKKRKASKEFKAEDSVKVASGNDEWPDSEPQEKLEKDLTEIVSPMMEHVPVTEYEEVCQDTALEISALSGQLLSSNEKGQQEKNLRKIRCRVRHFLTKCFLNIWIRRLFEKLKKKHWPCKKVHNAESVQELVGNVESWLESKNETSVFIALDDAASSSDLVFAETLSHMLYKQCQDDMHDDLSQCTPASHDKLRADIWSKSWICQVLMNWFLKSMLGQLISRIKLPTKKIIPKPQEEVHLSVASDDTEEAIVASDHTEEASDTSKTGTTEGTDEKLKVYISFLIEKVLHHMYEDAELMPNYNTDLVDHMAQKVCNELQFDECHITDYSFKKLDKIIHKKLCEHLGTIEEIMQLWTNSSDTTVPRCIASIAKNQLMDPSKKQNCVVRFFSRFFRRRHGPKFD